MSKVSVLIPARNERFLPQTVMDLLRNGSDIEVIAVLDGYWTLEDEYDTAEWYSRMYAISDKRLKFIHRGTALGMRAAINAAAQIATGEWLMKVDAHCMFCPGYDVVLQQNCEKNWIVIPRRHRLDPIGWCLQETTKPPIDYHYLSCPITNKDGYSMHGAVWNQRTVERMGDNKYDIDETMSFQGSLWFMHRDWWNFLGGMSEEGYGTFSQEPQEIGNKTWLGGGAVMTNKLTWYAHLHKGKTFGRMYSVSSREILAGHKYSGEYWMGNQWEGRIHDIDWLVDRFWPVPTWPEDWRERRFESVI